MNFDELDDIIAFFNVFIIFWHKENLNLMKLFLTNSGSMHDY